MKIKVFIFSILIFSNFIFAFPYENVVALSKSVCEMWILSGGKIKGATDDAFSLAEVKNAESIGTLTTSSFEKIISLEPDLVILTEDIPVHKKIASNLSALNIKTYTVSVKNFFDYERIMKDFCSMTDRYDCYLKNVVQVKERILNIIENRKKSDVKTYLFLRVSSTKNKVLKDHFANEIFENLGLKSILDDKNILDEISVEAILKENPDFIFVVAQGNQKKAEESFKKSYESNPVWKYLKAVKAGHVVILPKELFNYKPNANWDKAYKTILEIIE